MIFCQRMLSVKNLVAEIILFLHQTDITVEYKLERFGIGDIQPSHVSKVPFQTFLANAVGTLRNADILDL